MLQVWTRFAIFGEIHYFSPPKFLRKIMRRPDATRDLSTKDQLKENFPHARIISSNSMRALFLSKFRVQCFSSAVGVVFVSRQRQSRQCPRWLVAHYSAFLSTAPHGRLDGCGHRRRAGRGAAPHARRQQHPLRLPERRSEGWRRPAPPKPPEAYAWPSSSPCVLQHSRHGLRGAEHALCHRRAREAVPSKTSSIAQVWPSLATG